MLPKGIATSGFPRVRETCRSIGVEFDPWQTDLNRCLLGKTPDGLYAADTAVLSISRQVGKTFDVGAVVFALCIASPGTTVVWTAHRFKVARETFNELRGLAKSPKLVPHLDFDAITTAAGNECIPFRNGSRVLFAARERGAIRGFTKVGVLVLDEGQILTHSALADMVPTMNQAPNPLIIIMGTPPKPTDPSEVFTELRAEALAGASTGVLYVEFSADPGADPMDREQWRKANPSFPSRTPARAILRMRKLLSSEDFMREALGVWDSDSEGDPDRLNVAAWEAATDPGTSALLSCFAIESDLGRAWASIGAAGTRDDGATHLEMERQRGTKWLLPTAVELDERHDHPTWVVDGRGPCRDIIPELEDAGLRVLTASTDDVAQAYAWFTDALAGEGERLAHGPDDVLLGQVRAAKRRLCGDSGYTFAPRLSGGDISGVKAVALAGWAAQMASTGPNLW